MPRTLMTSRCAKQQLRLSRFPTVHNAPIDFSLILFFALFAFVFISPANYHFFTGRMARHFSLAFAKISLLRIVLLLLTLFPPSPFPRRREHAFEFRVERSHESRSVQNWRVRETGQNHAFRNDDQPKRLRAGRSGTFICRDTSSFTGKSDSDRLDSRLPRR